MPTEIEALDAVRHRGSHLDQPVADCVHDRGVDAQHAHGHAEVVARLGLLLSFVGGRRLVHAGVLHAVTRHELLAHRPELG